MTCDITAKRNSSSIVMSIVFDFSPCALAKPENRERRVARADHSTIVVRLEQQLQETGKAP